MRFLIVRNDKIGDLVLATPAILTLRANYPDAYIGVLVSEYAEEVIRNNSEINQTITVKNSKLNISKYYSLFKQIRRENYDVVIVLYPSFIICLLLFLAGIKRRISHGNKWYVYLFCNEILIQHRSRVEKHEADYNIDLVRVVGGIRKIIRETKIAIDTRELELTRKRLSAEGIDRYFVFHCGSGGSARNWGEINYALLADMVIGELKFPVIFTGRGSDRERIQNILNYMKNKAVYLETNTIRELTALIAMSLAFVGPSTGPLHIANALNIPVLGIYSPVRVQSEKRWGPYNTGRAMVISPDVSCPARYSCLYQKCRYYDCMDTIKPETVFKHFRNLVGRLE